MKKALFNELLASVREGGALLREQSAPSPSSHVTDPSVRDLRFRYRLSQEKFAALLGISVATLRNWEQGRRQPEGSARVLLRIADRHPEAVLDTVSIYSQGKHA